MEIQKLKKAICNNKTCEIEVLIQLSEKLKEENKNTSVISDLPKLLCGVFKYAFHEDAKYRKAAIPGFIELVNLLDLNKHLKEKPWWKEMKGAVLDSVDLLMKLVSVGDEDWAVLWSTTILLVGTDLRVELALLNKLLKVVEKAFKMNSEDMRKKCFECWCRLIDNFSIDRNELNNKRRLNLLVIPLKANNHNTQKLCALKMQTWKYLLSKLDQNNELTVQLVITHFLEFMFGGVGGVPPACKTLNADCANVFQKLLNNSELFPIVPELFVKYTFTCIAYICGDLEMSISVWMSLLGNIKHGQWDDTLVTLLMNSLNNVEKNSEFAKSKAYAEMIASLYSGNNCMPDILLVKQCKTIFSLVLEPNVLLHFTETKCEDLLKIIANSNPVLLPENTLNDLISKMSDLSASESFRDNKLKLLRGIWINLTNIICTWMSENGQLGKDGTVLAEMRNIHQLLLFGAADLSTMWNKYQMKIWKTLFSESTKYFSLLPEAACDTFASNLVKLLQDNVHKKRITLHVAVDLVTIILEFDVSKDSANILPLMVAIGECAMSSLLQDISGISFLNQFTKTVVIAAKKEPALINDILSLVIEKMLKYMEEFPFGSHHDEIRNMILKAQHQVQVLKPSRTQKKSVSPVVAQPASSPTMTSFLHRLAKAKETQAKMNSPNGTQICNISSSPARTPNSKNVISPLADLKSENFVFVPPKSRKTVLTDHQKESLTTRKHDIPALYQDLSQDSSQSALESIVSSVQPSEDVQRKHELSSPIEVSQAGDMRVKTVSKKIINSNTVAETEKNKCKENLSSDETDQVNNNAHSIFSSLRKTDSYVKTLRKSGLNDDNSKTVFETAPKTTVTSEKYKTNLLNKNTPDGKNISEQLINNDKMTNCTSQAECIKIKQQLQDSGPFDDRSKVDNKELNIDTNKEPSGTPSDSISQDKTNKISGGDKPQEESKTLMSSVSSSKKEDTTSDSKCNNKSNKSPVLNKSYTGMCNEQVTPKRSMRKNKLIITIEKKTKTPNSQIKETVGKPKTSSTNKASQSTSPKISPRRLRKRKSGVTPILSGGKVPKKSRKGSLNTSNLDSASKKNVTQENSDLSSKVCQSGDSENIENENLTLSAINCDSEKVSSDTDINCESLKFAPSNDVQNRNLTSITVSPTEESVATNTSICSPVKVILHEVKLPNINIDIQNTDSSKECKQGINSPLNNMVEEDGLCDINLPDKLSLNNNLGHVAEANNKDINAEKNLQDENKISLSSNQSIECGLKESFGDTENELIQTKNTRSKSMEKTLICEKEILHDQQIVVDKNRELKSLSTDSKSDKNCRKSSLNENNVKEEKSISIKKTLLLDDINSTINKPIDENQLVIEEQLTSSIDSIMQTSKEATHSNNIHQSKEMDIVSNKVETAIHEIKCTEQLTKNKDMIDSENLETEHEKPVVSISEYEHNNIDHKKEISSDLFKNKTKLCDVKETINSERENAYIVKDQVSSDKDKECTTNRTCDSTDSYLITRTQAQENNTPSKSAQKALKQTQLPFTPIQKTQDLDKNKSNIHPEETSLKSNTRQINEKIVSVTVKKLSESQIEVMCSPDKAKHESNIILEGINLKAVKEKASVKLETANKVQNKNTAVNNNVIQQEVPRTPEKSNTLNELEIVNKDLSVHGVKKYNAESSPTMEPYDAKSPPLITIRESPPLITIRESPPLITISESPNKETESQDFIASSQENELTTLSLIKSDQYNDSVSYSPSKALRKCPKKYEGVSYSQMSNSSVRSRRSPLRVDSSPRCSSTPLKKSVCRRLDVEIDEDLSEIPCSGDVKENRLKESVPMSGEVSEQGQSTSGSNECSEELLINDIKLLNEDNATFLNNTLDSVETVNLEPNNENGEVDQSSANCENEPPTPGNQNSLKRFLPHSNSSSIESPKRSKVSINIENTSSPKSPSSRTNHMMELAMKDKEQIMSSPVTSLKKRRINPVRVGPVIKTPKNQSNKVRRIHKGPSEEWVRRTYSPSASPNNSILKRRSCLPTMGSPDSSPPSIKKKRVSFLDPPVSESLLFSKFNPGHGKVQRSEVKQECESEEIPSQGSIQLAVSPQSSDQTSVFSPLKLCANPLTDVLERTVSLQWISDLEDQLGRLGVTTIGQLSSLTETTVERLPFIPPKVERLRKILQNYFNEISDKPDGTKSESLPVNNEEKSSESEQIVTDSNVELAKPSDLTTTTDEEDYCVPLIADKIENYIKKHPELIKELGDRLDVDVILSILNCAVSKLKNKNDTR